MFRGTPPPRTLFSTRVCTNVAPNQQPQKTASPCLSTGGTCVSPVACLLTHKSPAGARWEELHGHRDVELLLQATRPDMHAPRSLQDAHKHSWDAGTWGLCGMWAHTVPSGMKAPGILMGCIHAWSQVGCWHLGSLWDCRDASCPVGCTHIWSPMGHRHLGSLWDACTHGPLWDTGRGAGNGQGTSIPPGQIPPKSYCLPTAQTPAGHPPGCLPADTSPPHSAWALRQHPRSHSLGCGRRRNADASAAFQSPVYQMGPNYQQERDSHYPRAVWVPPAASSLALPMTAGAAPQGHHAPHAPQCLESISNAEKHPDRFLNLTK